MALKSVQPNPEYYVYYYINSVRCNLPPKLIRWRIIVHGGIDGYSRVVLFLECSSNNLSNTVATLYSKACQEYGWPSRLRCDLGVENNEVKRMMIAKRGEGRGSVLCGSSVHNQRIERLWKDVRRCVLQYFRNIFYFMEDNGILVQDSNIDLFCLHYVYVPRINSCLQLFRARWNSHTFSTAGYKSPNKLFIKGLLDLYGSTDTAAVDIFENNAVDLDTYGIEEDISAAEPTNEDGVIVPETVSPVPSAFVRAMMQKVDPMAKDNNHGIPTFQRVRTIIDKYLML